MKKSKFGLGLLFGAVAGVVTGLLTAPRSGKETRDDLKRRAATAQKDMAATAEHAKDRAAEIRKRVDDMRERASETPKVTKAKEAAEKAVDAAKK